MVSAIKWDDDKLMLLDQRLLPDKVEYVNCVDFRQAAKAIRDMVVRGAPAIGITGGYALAMATMEAAQRFPGPSKVSLQEDFIKRAASTIMEARPTAVNLAWAVNRVMSKTIEKLKNLGIEEAIKVSVFEAKSINEEDIEINRKIGENGAKLIKPGSRVLTHCNAGALATGGYGTALGVIRQAWKQNKVTMVYADETRPYLQGARLTAWELLQDGISVTVLADSAAGHLMSLGKVDVVIVGADRIASNGDVANKIGTFSLACLCSYHKIPFYVAAPVSTFDLSIDSGKDIPIEERSEREILEFRGVAVAPKGAKAFNPAFDVTPASLISAIITEKGVIFPPFRENLPRYVR